MVKNPDSAPIIRSRILCVLHNIQARIFRAFEIKAFNMEPIKTLPQFEPEEDEKRLVELLHQLTRLSSYLVYTAMKLCIIFDILLLFLNF